MLVFNLKKKWFELFQNGGKTVEYRIAKPYWTIRIYNELYKLKFRHRPNLVQYIKKYHTPETFMQELIGMNPFIITEKDNIIIPCILRLGYTKTYLTANIKKILYLTGHKTDLKTHQKTYAFFLEGIKNGI